MAINFLNTVNLNKNQLTQRGDRKPTLRRDPVGANAVEGQIYFNTVDLMILKIFAYMDLRGKK